MPRDVIVASIGKCIYCGAENVELTDEHIVPYALGGNLVLERASCIPCQDITKSVEQNVLRPMFGLARVKLGIQTRHKKDRKNPFRVKVVPTAGSDKYVHVDSGRLPAFVILPYFDRPGILIGRGPTPEIPIIDWWGSSLETDPAAMLKSLANEHGHGEILLSKLRFDELARMIAKIAHCMAVGHFGLGSFAPFLPDIILRKSSNIADFFGGSANRRPKEPKYVVAYADWMNGPHGEFLIAEIRIFALLGAPIFEVVIGRRPNQAL